VIPTITSGPIHAAVLAIAETFAAEIAGPQLGRSAFSLGRPIEGPGLGTELLPSVFDRRDIHRLRTEL
jgi:hypothetical protein